MGRYERQRQQPQRAERCGAKTADKTITMTINSKEFYVNGEKQPELNEPAQLMNDKTMVPLRAVSESLDCTVEWDQEAKTVIIQSKK